MPKRQSIDISLSSAKGFAAHRCEAVSVGYGYETDPRRYAFDNRAREKFSLFQYTLSGAGRFRAGARGAEVALPAGRGFLVNCPSATWYWLPAGGTWEFLYVLFVGDVGQWHVEQLIATHGHVFAMPATAAPVELLRRLYDEAAAGTTHDKFLLSARVYQFLMELYRQVRPRQPAEPAIDRAVRFIEQTYGNVALSMDDLAARAGLSKFHFSRLFRERMGVSPFAYVTQVRMNKAMDLLISTQMPVKQISQTVGFSDYSYFCRIFRQHCRTTPGRVRQSAARLSTTEQHSRRARDKTVH